MPTDKKKETLLAAVQRVRYLDLGDAMACAVHCLEPSGNKKWFFAVVEEADVADQIQEAEDAHAEFQEIARQRCLVKVQLHLDKLAKE